MTYGDQLDAAAAGLARAHAMLRDPPLNPAARASAALSRAAFYRSLERQVLAVGRVHTNQLPPPGEVLPPPQSPTAHHDPVLRLAVCLRQAVSMTVTAGRTVRADLPVAGPVTAALYDAAQALRTAGDILISNTGPHTHPAAAPQPLTSEGMTIVAGTDVANNLAALAHLAASAAAIDKRLARWFRADNAPGDLEPLLKAAAADAAGTGELAALAKRIASAGLPAKASARRMTVAPPIDDPHRWSHPTSTAECVDAIDAARSWLVRSGDRLTIGQLATTAGAALAMTHHIGHVYRSVVPDFAFAREDAAAALPWRIVLSAAADLRSPAPAAADHTTLRVAVTSAATWLRQQVRPDGHWLGPVHWAPSAAARSAWCHDAQQLATRLPDLADLLHDAIRAVGDRGGVLAPTGQLSRTTGSLVYTPGWGPAPSNHPAYRSMLTGLRRAAVSSRAFAMALGAQPRSGLADVRRERPLIPAAARLARQWYPQPDDATQPTDPPAQDASGRTTHRPCRRALPGAEQQPRRRR